MNHLSNELLVARSARARCKSIFINDKNNSGRPGKYHEVPRRVSTQVTTARRLKCIYKPINHRIFEYGYNESNPAINHFSINDVPIVCRNRNIV